MNNSKTKLCDACGLSFATQGFKLHSTTCKGLELLQSIQSIQSIQELNKKSEFNLLEAFGAAFSWSFSSFGNMIQAAVCCLILLFVLPFAS
jgi:hypothetical protein